MISVRSRHVDYIVMWANDDYLIPSEGTGLFRLGTLAFSDEVFSSTIPRPCCDVACVVLCFTLTI